MSMDDDSYYSSQISTQGLRETQEITDSQNLDQSLNEEPVWGRLLSVRRGVQVYDLSKNSYSFGRGEADHRFTEKIFDRKILPAISKIHFVISRELKSDMEAVVVLEDRSQNGTYVNKILIGKHKKKVLLNNDVIALAQANQRIFVFYNCLKNDASEYPKILTEKYTMTRKIGDGSFGEVRLAYTQGTLERVAVKILKKKILSSAGNTILFNPMGQIDNEIKLLQSIDHPCIVRFLDLIESPEKIYIIMELADGGELYDRISNNGCLKEPVAKLYFYQLVHAVSYLHRRKITHRDIKPENILLATEEQNTRIKLTDFGLSKLTQDTSIMTTFCGTQMYIAPELLAAESRSYTKKVDMWSLGVVLYVCLSGCAPFQAKNDMEMRSKIKNGNYTMNNKSFALVSADAKDLVAKLLVVDPCSRLSAEQVLKHCWFDDPFMLETAQNLFDKSDISPSPPKRTRDNDNSEDTVDAKTPKLMNCIEFNLTPEGGN